MYTSICIYNEYNLLYAINWKRERVEHSQRRFRRRTTRRDATFLENQYSWLWVHIFLSMALSVRLILDEDECTYKSRAAPAMFTYFCEVMKMTYNYMEASWMSFLVRVCVHKEQYDWTETIVRIWTLKSYFTWVISCRKLQMVLCQNYIINAPFTDYSNFWICYIKYLN